jgi:hypothetical protein
MVGSLGSYSRASSSGVRPARTSAMICSRNSGGYGGLVLGIVDSFLYEEMKCPRNGVNSIPPSLRFQACRCGEVRDRFAKHDDDATGMPTKKMRRKASSPSLTPNGIVPTPEERVDQNRTPRCSRAHRS